MPSNSRARRALELQVRRWASSRRRTRCRAEEAVDHDLGRSASSTVSYRASSPRARARHVVVLVRRCRCRRQKNTGLFPHRMSAPSRHVVVLGRFLSSTQRVARRRETSRCSIWNARFDDLSRTSGFLPEFYDSTSDAPTSPRGWPRELVRTPRVSYCVW